MSHRRKFFVLAAVVVTLLALGVSQLQAQSPLTLEGLSERISALAGTVSTLRRNSATKSEVRALRGRVATLEARLDETPTATPQPPTATPTPEPATATATATVTATATASASQVLPTATPTPATPYLTTRGRMNVRGGPGTNYAIVGAAAAGARLEITGKNAGGDWWRIDYQGQHGWIYAPFVTATNADGVEVAPTPVPPPTPVPATDGNAVRCAQQR